MSTTQESAPEGVRRRPKDRRQQILVAARDLFVERGYHNVTVTLIAERVGITASALYRHFANKAVLLEAVVGDSFAAADPVVGEGDVLSDVLDRAVQECVASPHLGPLWTREARHLPEEVHAEIRQRLRQSTEFWVPLIRAEHQQLSAEQAHFVAWCIQSLLASSGHHVNRMPAAVVSAVVLGASLAVCRVELEAPRPPVSPPSGDRLLAFSRRERMLVAASRLFGERGYQGTALSDIGAAADVTGPNLYGYFDSKADLLRAVVDRATHALWLDLDATLAAHSDARSALGDLVAGYVGRSREWAGLGGGEFSGEPDVESVQRANGREYVAEWVALVRRSRPDLDQQTARVLVHGAQTVIADLVRTPHLTADGAFSANLTTTVLAILDS